MRDAGFSALLFVLLPGIALAEEAEGAASLEPPLHALPRWQLAAPSFDLGATLPLRVQAFDPSKPLPPGMQPPPEYPYTEGHLLPEGYHIEERPKRGLLVAGYLVTGIPYGLGLLVGAAKRFDNEMHWLVVPFAGPWLTFAFRHRACNEIGETAFDSPHCVFDRMSEWLLIADGVVQAAGGTLLLIGYTSTSPFAVRDGASLSVGPVLVGSGAGAGAFGTW